MAAHREKNRFINILPSVCSVKQTVMCRDQDEEVPSDRRKECQQSTQCHENDVLLYSTSSLHCAFRELRKFSVNTYIPQNCMQTNSSSVDSEDSLPCLLSTCLAQWPVSTDVDTSQCLFSDLCLLH